MENGAFSAGAADRLEAEQGPQSPPPPMEMKTHRPPPEEKQPLCKCDTHCACVEAADPRPDRTPQLEVKSWNRAKTAVLAVGVVALVVWCGVMAAMYHYGVL